MIIITILLGLLMFSLGFGVSQTTVVADVREHTTRIESNEKDIDRLLGMMSELIKQNVVLIAHLESQDARDFK